MFRVFSLAVLFALALAVAPHAQGNVAGAWDLSINGPQGMIAAGATLKQDGDKLTGTITSPQGDAQMTGSVKGNTITLSFSMAGPDGPLEIKINGEVTGDTVKGMLDFGMGQADFTGTRKK